MLPSGDVCFIGRLESEPLFSWKTKDQGVLVLRLATSYLPLGRDDSPSVVRRVLVWHPQSTADLGDMKVGDRIWVRATTSGIGKEEEFAPTEPAEFWAQELRRLVQISDRTVAVAETRRQLFALARDRRSLKAKKLDFRRPLTEKKANDLLTRP